MRPAEQIRRRDNPPTMAQIQIQAPSWIYSALRRCGVTVCT
jgi:hypothetical protein